jgi:catechol 2,3-dioxygenase-like lactoylglutathione lyase family enzyme
MSQGFEGNAHAKPILHHVNLKTTRLQEMIDWYATVAGLTTVFQTWAGLLADLARVLILSLDSASQSSYT